MMMEGPLGDIEIITEHPIGYRYAAEIAEDDSLIRIAPIDAYSHWTEDELADALYSVGERGFGYADNLMRRIDRDGHQLGISYTIDELPQWAR